MPDSKRALAIGRQATVDVAAATLNWMNFLRGPVQHTPGVEYEIPEYEAYSRWRQRTANVVTKMDSITFTLDVDTTDIGWVLLNLGAPASASNTHDFIPGVNAGNVATPLLTVLWENAYTAHKMINAVVSRIRGNYTIPNTFTLEVTIVGVMDTIGAAVTPTFAPPPDNSPLKPWQTLLYLNTEALCIVSFSFDLAMGADPFYCSPTEEIDADTEPGLKPSRYLEGNIVGTYSVSYEYVGYAGSSYESMRKNIREAWVIKGTDPHGEVENDLAYLPTVQFEFPNLQGTAGGLDESQANSLQPISGSILYDSTLGAGMKIRLINGKTAYAAS